VNPICMDRMRNTRRCVVRPVLHTPTRTVMQGWESSVTGIGIDFGFVVGI
jgi:hypothetical protein